MLGVAPDYPLAHYNLGVIALAEQRMGDAIARFERALKARPDYAEAHNNLGVALERTARAKDAEQQYREALAARPNHAAAHNNLGRTLLARGEAAEAVSHFRAALRSQPDNPDALVQPWPRARCAGSRPRRRAGVAARACGRPDSVAVLIDLAWLLATNPRSAIRMTR